jgi:hypothetical protein
MLSKLLWRLADTMLGLLIGVILLRPWLALLAHIG